MALSESGPSGAALVFELGAYDTTHVSDDGVTYTIFQAEGMTPAGEEGAPTLPAKTILLAVPHGARVSVKSRPGESSWLEGAVPPPWPKEMILDDGLLSHAVAELTADPRFYAAGPPYPRDIVEVVEAGTLRGKRMVSVGFLPFRFHPGRNGVEVIQRIDAEIEFTEGERGRVEIPRKGDGRWEPVLRGLILNYEDGSGWRRAPTAAPTADRSLGPENPEFKIRVTETALYRLDFDRLAAEGFPPDLDTEWPRLYEKAYDPAPEVQATVETEVPVLVHDSDSDGLFGPGDYIVFYGLSYWDGFPGEFGRGSRLRPHVYWLSWDEAGGSRMDTAPAWGDFQDPEIPFSFPETIHMEEDLVINRAPYDPEVRQFWLLPRVGEKALPFEVPSPDTERPYGVRLMMQPEQRGSHYVSLYVGNGEGATDTVVVRFRFDTPSTLPSYKPPVLFDSQMTRPAGFLSDGRNTLRFVGERNVGGEIAAGSAAYMDWFEVRYYRRYAAWDDGITCSAGGAGRPQQVEITDFGSADVLAFDVTDGRTPVAFDLGAENLIDAGDGTYTLILRGEFPQERRIAAVAVAGLKSPEPDAIEADKPSDLRAEGAGSDYLVIVYDEFASEIEPLVDLRRAQGFEPAVAKVSDVYDEFGDGHRSDESIKAYLTYAYNNWGSAYALLVGDANEDTENLMNGPEGAPTPPNLVPSPLIRHDAVSTAPSGPEIVNSDSWYAVGLDGIGGDWIPDMFIGRLPAGNRDEARELVSKTVDYEDLSAGDEWRSRGLFVTDDNYSSSIFFSASYCISSSETRYFEPVSDRASAALEDEESGVPGFEAPVFKLGNYLWNVPEVPKKGCYSGFVINDIQDTTRTRVTPALLDSMSMGWLFVNYQGHGNEKVWAHETLFGSFVDFPEWDDVPKLGNTRRPFVLLAFSCHVADFDYIGEGDGGDSMAERMMLLPDAGAVAAFASTGYEYLSTATFNEPVIDALFIDPPVEEQSGEVYIRLGPALVKGEATYWGSAGSNRSALQTYALLADPALRLDAAPPRITAVVGDTVLADGDRLESRDAGNTFDLRFDIRDEVAVDSSSVFLREVWHRFEGQDSTYDVPPSEYAISRDSGGRRFRADYTLRLLPASMEMIAGAVDRNGRASTMTLRAVLSAVWKADGRPLSPADLVAPSSDLAVKVSSPVPVEGEALSVAVDGVREKAFSKRGIDALGREWELSAESYPLEEGSHTLALLVDGRVAASTTVRVNTGFRFSSIVPYPNPCAEEGTTFFYELASEGAVDIEEVVLKIYSVSGRLVTELTAPSPGTGRGSIHWDLTDGYGEVVANGVYICRAIASDSRGKKARILGKVAVAR